VLGHPAKKYVSVDEFSRYCTDLKALRSNVSAQDRLEIYAKRQLLQPMFVLLAPPEHVQATYRARYGLSYDPSHYSEEFEQLQSLVSNFASPLANYLPEAIAHGHPLEKASNAASAFVVPFSNWPVRAWRDTKVNVEEGLKLDTTEFYYGPWQVFALDEIEVRNSVTINTIIHPGAKVPPRPPKEARFARSAEELQHLANWRMLRALASVDTIGYGEATLKKRRMVEQKRRSIAGEQLKRLNDESWLNLLRMLVERHKHYEEYERIALADELKKYIADLGWLLIMGKNWTLEQVSEFYDGAYKGLPSICRGEKGHDVYPGIVLRMFPDEELEVRTRAAEILESHLRNPNVSKTLQYEEGLPTAIVNAVEASGHGLLLVTLYQMDRLWDGSSMHRWENLWSQLRSLAVAVDALGQQWYASSSINGVLVKACGPRYEQTKRNMLAGQMSPSTAGEYRAAIAAVTGSNRRLDADLFGTHLVVADLTRNYLAHKMDIDDDDLTEAFFELPHAFLLTLAYLYKSKPDVASP
jgi:hypothetical protein